MVFENAWAQEGREGVYVVEFEVKNCFGRRRRRRRRKERRTEGREGRGSTCDQQCNLFIYLFGFFFLGQNSHNGDKRKSSAKGTKDFILFYFILFTYFFGVENRKQKSPYLDNKTKMGFLKVAKTKQESFKKKKKPLYFPI